MNYDMKRSGAYIQNLRIRNGYTQGELAKAMNIGQSFLSRIEAGKRIYRRYLDGCSLGQIRTELEADGIPTASGVRGWTYQVIRNILTNERYIGDALLQKTYTTDCISKTVRKNQGDRPMVYVEKNHPAIISKAVFYQVREEMTRRSSKRKVMQKTGKTDGRRTR